MSADSLSPQIVARLLKEIKGLVKSQKQEDPEIEYIENDDNSISEVQCYIYGPSDTPYYGGKILVCSVCIFMSSKTSVFFFW